MAGRVPERYSFNTANDVVLAAGGLRKRCMDLQADLHDAAIVYREQPQSAKAARSVLGIEDAAVAYVLICEGYGDGQGNDPEGNKLHTLANAALAEIRKANGSWPGDLGSPLNSELGWLELDALTFVESVEKRYGLAVPEGKLKA